MTLMLNLRRICLFVIAVGCVCSCTSASRHRQGVLQIAGETALGFYYDHKRWPSERELLRKMFAETQTSLEPGDRLEINALWEGSSAPAVEIRIVTSNGEAVAEEFKVDP